MGTHVEIDQALLDETIAAAGLGSPTATVEEALRRLLQDFKLNQAVDDLAGIGWEGDLDAMREGRSHDEKL